MTENFKIEELRQKPIAMMTGAELEFLISHSVQQLHGTQQPVKSEEHLYYGIKGIEQLFGCSTSTANRIKSSGVIDEAIVQAGRKIIVHGDKALALVKAAGGISSINK